MLDFVNPAVTSGRLVRKGRELWLDKAEAGNAAHGGQFSGAAANCESAGRRPALDMAGSSM